MQLAEALSLRADAVRRIEQLRSRITSNARIQEGEEPSENAAALLAEARRVFDELVVLIGRINKTNTVVRVGSGSMTDALAQRDVLRMRHKMLTDAADAASGRDSVYARQMRSELAYVSLLPVANIRSEADSVSEELRELDVQIQRMNWTSELSEA